MSTPLQPRGAPHQGPPLPLLIGVHIALFVASVAVLNGVTTGSWPRSGAGAEDIAAFVRANASSVQIAGMLQFAASVPLALYGATASSRLRHLGIRAAGTVIALVGGVIAAGLLALSGLNLVLAGAIADEAGPETLLLVHAVVFITGGAGTVVYLGLLVAGVIVTSLFGRLLPRWLCWTGLAVAAASEAATLSLALPSLNVLIPVGRFAGMAVLAAAAVLLPTRRSTGSRT